MALELSPHAESLLEQEAAREGISIDTLIVRTFSPRPTVLQKFKSNTDAEKRATVLAYINLPQEEVARRHETSIAHLQAKIESVANATPEEIAEAEAEWQTYKQSMNENRRATGERLLYPEASQP